MGLKSILLVAVALIAIVSLIYAFAGIGGPSVPLADDSGYTEEGVDAVVEANNQFAFDMYSGLSGEEGNVFFSPYSISVALTMTYEGARGETAEEMQSILHIPEDDDVRRPNFARIHNIINKRDKKYQLHTANALWAQEDYQFLDEYFDVIHDYYGGRVANLDFIEEREKSRQIINEWVEQQTNNRIKDLIPEGVLDSMTRLVLTNAIYFKGNWAKQFDKSLTTNEDFRISPTETVEVPMMRMVGEEAEFNYTETDTLQVLELPYKDNELSMLVLLPKEDDMESLESSLSTEMLYQVRNDIREQRVDVYLPKFKFETKYFLSDTLKTLGMQDAFLPGIADLSGMDGTRDFFITNVIHQAFVEVNEEGTEAAAATAVIVGKTSIPEIKVFRADHPFIFIIQERDTGNILFMGKVVDPS